MSSRSLWSVLLCLVATAAVGQTTSVELDDVTCVGLEPDAPNYHALATATLNPDLAGVSVRLYMRRMNLEVEDFYWEEMRTDGNGGYWGVMMDPEDVEFKEKELDDGDSTQTEWADWWKAKEASDDRDPNGDLDTDLINERAQVGKLEERTWMNALSNQELQDWLEALPETDNGVNEPVEYYVAVVSPDGTVRGKSDMKVAPVQEDCRFNLTPQQRGESENQTVGETAYWQRGKIPFHWECTHIVTRVDPQDVAREDEICRLCVVAGIAGWIPAAIVGAGVVGAILISDDDDPPPASPSEP